MENFNVSDSLVPENKVGDEINIDDGSRTSGQFSITYQESGYGGCIPVINGKPAQELMFGYVSESDKTAALNLIKEALIATKGDTYKAARYMMKAVKIAAKGVKLKEAEAVTVDGVEFLINYETKKIYKDEDELANLDDIPCALPPEAIKAMLIDRAKLAMATKYAANDDYDDDYDDEDYDDDEELW